MEANLDFITDNLAVGGDLSYDDEKAARQAVEIVDNHNITRIIDMRIEANDEGVWNHFDEVTYFHVPEDDQYGHHMAHQAFDIVVGLCRGLPPNERVLVHCHMGVNRAPSAAFAVLLDRGMDPVEAYDLIRSQRTQAGLAYAMDAFDAHHQREGTESDRVDAERDRLSVHIATVMTVAEKAKINHVIRQGHKNDRLERLVAESRG